MMVNSENDKAVALLNRWAAEAHVQFVSRSDGQRTTGTVSRDALLQLIRDACATPSAASTTHGEKDKT